MSAIDDILQDIPLPRVLKIGQITQTDGKLTDVAGTTRATLGESGLLERIVAGQQIAVTAGSRGIVHLPEILKTVCREISEKGATPFLVPAMGSHGGATSEGQRELLEHMGVTEQFVGAAIRSSMEVEEVGRTDDGLPVCIDKHARAADGIVIVNRIKPHVAFRGRYESGLMKMLAIGLGKQRGAEICHDLGFANMERNIENFGRTILANTPVLVGVAILENARHETARVEVIAAEKIAEKEPALQEESKQLLPRLLFEKLDVLIIDEIGKDISGTGFDNNVVGRYHTNCASGGPDIRRIGALDITEKSGGNGNGLGILDFTTKRAFEKFDFEKTYPNSLTSTVPMSVKIPMVLKNDKQAFQTGIKTCNVLDKTSVQLVRIKNTLSLDTLEVSESLLPQIENNSQFEILSGVYELPFDDKGNLF